MSMVFRSGFITILGRPNTGKSSLVNALAGQKVAIVSDRPQTTRNQIRAVLTTEHGQLIFIDTPGVHKPLHLLGETMVRRARDTVEEVDLVFFVVEAQHAPGRGDGFVVELLRRSDTPIFIVLNKMDLVIPERGEKHAALYRELCPRGRLFKVSALRGTGLDSLVQEALALLPEGPHFYPPEMLTDQPESFLASEVIREKAIALTRQEIPFALAVVIEEFTLRPDASLLDIRAHIFVERKSQVGIIVGRGGAMIREIGVRARRELEALLGERIFLDLRVKVKRDWRNRLEELRRLGYS